jgi:hypothetical protein
LKHVARGKSFCTSNFFSLQTLVALFEPNLMKLLLKFARATTPLAPVGLGMLDTSLQATLTLHTGLLCGVDLPPPNHATRNTALHI